MSRLTQFGNDLYTGERSFDFVGRRRTWYVIAAVFVILAIGLTALRGGFVFGIEFRGGSEFRVQSTSVVEQGTAAATALADEAVSAVVPGANPRVSIVGGDSVRVQTEQLTPAQTDDVRAALAEAYGVPVSDVSASFIGASWGADITRQALIALVVFLLLASLVLAIYFRTWKMSVAALIALFHDLVVTAGVYGVFGLEITPAAVIGFLTILGYSLYDTVVVFDKVRENTSEDGVESRRTFAQSVNLAVNQTLVRSINTSIVAVLPTASILLIGSVLLGAGTLRDIALALTVGTIVGTYSSIFLAAPLYVHLRQNEPELKKQGSRPRVARTESGAVR
ncbi:protein translocase subunit SecF [Microcella frigidaquae]|uniref:Protein-export membrane protein SecF n=1 Tax=Microcella frigidaquae TaxID=424758 RepID=A0A840XDQ8_9MICO|nr:protein translocase subunit SecF [Microcella frigidaquae]MBB5616652.1 preprotein translocase subunit SecF [Microcella frigidaquae]NHN43906.1 protein translocase subunit SecF [Microcella frigidaquae]